MNLRKKYLKLLGLGDNQLVKQLAGYVIGEVAIVSPDFFFIEGTSIAVVLELKNPTVFDAYMNLKFKPSKIIKINEEEVHEFNHMGRKLFYQKKGNVAVLCSSLTLLESMLSAKKSSDSLSQAGDFKYIRKLLPRTENEVAFIYFSDAAIRKWLSPKYKILGARRIQDQSRFIHDQLRKIIEGNQDKITPCEYGTPWSLTPIGELPFDQVTKTERDSYQRFIRNYNSYWSKYFDPIGVQINRDKKGLSFKTVVLPLIENSIYMSLKEMIGDAEPTFSKGLVQNEICQVSIQAKTLPFLSTLNRKMAKDISGLIKKTSLRIFDGEPIIYADLIKLQSSMGSRSRGMFGYLGFVSFLTMPSCIEIEHTSLVLQRHFEIDI